MLFSGVMKSIYGLAGGSMADQIASVYADKGYDSEAIRNYLKDRGIVPCISVQEEHQTVRGQLVQKVQLCSVCCGTVL